jgi:hypothetical protein
MRFSVIGTLPGRLISHGTYSGQRLNQGLMIHDSECDCNYAVIKLRKSYTIVDELYYDSIVKHKTWSDSGSNGYVAAFGGIILHSLIMESERQTNLTVDHINWNKLDNRKSNLRIVDMSSQNNNRNTRSDREIAPDEVLYCMDNKYLPTYIRHDKTENKFTFSDHPYLKRLEKTSYNSTKSTSATMVQKLMDVLMKYIEMHNAYNKCYPEEYEKSQKLIVDRTRLATEFSQISQVVNQYDNSYEEHVVDLTSLNGDLELATIILERLVLLESTNISEVKMIGGPKNLSTREVNFPQYNAVARIKGEYVTIYDDTYKEALKNVNWDSEDTRIHLSPAMKNAFPVLKEYLKKKIILAEFVFWVLADSCRYQLL